MSFFGGGQKSASAKPQYTGLQLQTSALGLAVPYVAGTTRISPNIFWYADFQAIPQQSQQAAGKGGGTQQSTSYTYRAAVMLGLCEGPISNIGQAWADKTLTNLSDLGLSLFTGTNPQAIWGYLTSKHADQALAYPSTAHVATGSYDLGGSAGLPNHSFEVVAHVTVPASPNGFDAEPAALIQDFLVNPQYGAGFPSALIDTVSLSTGAASFKQYCAVLGIGLSPGLTDQQAARDRLTLWLQLTNTAAVWSGNLLKFIPYGDQTIGGNDATYTPDVTPIYDLTDDDFVLQDGNDPVIVTRSDAADAYNHFKIEILDRANQYNTTSIETKDQASIEIYGDRLASTITAHEICDQATAAIVLELIKQHALYIRNTYQFQLSWEYCLLEPMDLVTLTDPNLGLAQTAVRIVSIEEDENGILSVVAEEFPAGVATASLYPKQSRAGFAPDFNLPPGPVNAPVIFEPAADLAALDTGGGQAQVWVGVSGAPASWGGATVWLSPDGTSFKSIGQVTGPARQGHLTATLAAPSGGNPDTVSTLAVDLSESGGQLVSGTQADAQAGRTLCWVDGEIIAFAMATLTGAGQYALSWLERGLYGTAATSHAAGALFTRLDATIFKYDLPPQYVGQNLYLKFTSRNIYGAAEQSLADVTAYGLTPAGTGFYIAPPSDVVIAPAPYTQADGTSILALLVGWTASPGPLLAEYEVQWKAPADADWSSLKVGANTTSMIVKPAVANVSYQARVRALTSTDPVNTSAWATASATDSGALVTSVPGAPTGMTATGGTRAIEIVWSRASDATIMGYRLYAVAGHDGDFADAALIFDGNATAFTHLNLGYGVTYSYFLAAYNVAGASSAAGPVFATTDATIPITALGTQVIDESLLVPALSSKIDLITAPATTVGSVAAQVQGVGDVLLAAVADVQNSLETASNGIVRLATQLDFTRTSFKNAGFIVDPADASITFSAIDQVRTDLSTSVNNVQVSLDAANASISLKADASYVNQVAANIIAGTQPAYNAQFQNALLGWTASGATLTANAASVTFTSTGTVPSMSVSGLSITGSANTLVSIGVRRLDAGTSWLGVLQYTTAGHGASSIYQVAIPQPTSMASFAVLTWDMSGLADWTGGVITGLTLLLSNQNGDSFEIQFVQAGPNTLTALLLGNATVRLSSAEANISGLQAAIALTASQTQVTNHEARITTAELNISANSAAIALKASTTDLTATTARVTTAESNIDSLQGQITNQVSAVTLPGAEAAGEAAVYDALLGAQTADYIRGSIALARQNLQAYTDTATSAEASLRTDLAVQVAASKASLTTESTVRADADSALSQQITTLAATVNTNNTTTAASVVNEATARAVADTALSTQISTLTATVNGNTSGIATEATARAAADTALSNLVTMLTGTVATNNATVTGQISTEATVRLSADQALSTLVTNLTATVTGNNSTLTAAISSEASVRAGADATAASQISTLQTTVGGHTASISTLASSVGGITAEYTIKTQAMGNGKLALAGIGLIADGTTDQSEIDVIANKFVVVGVDNLGHTVAVSPFYVQDGNCYVQALYAGTINVNQLTAVGTTTSLLTITPPSDGSGGLKVYDTGGNLVLDPTHGIFPGAVSLNAGATDSHSVTGSSVWTVVSGSMAFTSLYALVFVTFSSTQSLHAGTDTGLNIALTIGGTSVFATSSLTGVSGSFTYLWKGGAGVFAVAITAQNRDSNGTPTVTAEIDVMIFKA